MCPAPGARIGPYDVIAPLGSGGMGEVFRARDSRLEREVAIKLLPSESFSDPEARERLMREARAAAAMNHPNVCTIHEVGEEEGRVYIAMELIEGTTLAQRVERMPAGMPAEQVVRYGAQIAEALAHAHERRVVHRDLKSSNVVVTPEGRVKVLDFGVARRTWEAGEEPSVTAATLTGTGTIVGTPQYLAPEVLLGAKADARSDQWALGVVLHEMASGELPFKGRTLPELSASILHVAPAPLPGRIPSGLAGVVTRCLAKEPGERYASTSEVRAALEALLPGVSETTDTVRGVASRPPAPADTKSIVVLPFANLSPDPDTEYFSDGLTDEIITDLSRVRALRVISRSSAMRLKGDARGLTAIGRDLACRYVLEGSVRRAANTLRITARLVDAPNDEQVWADKYGGTLDDVFDIQERVSRSIVDALEIRLTPQEVEQLAERPIAEVRAQECYLRAQSETWSFLPGSVDKAINHLEAALNLIGDNALLYQGLGVAYFQYVNVGAASGREQEFIKRAESCADKIFALESESPRGYLVRANVQLARGDIHGCGRSLRRVLQAFPNEVLALQLYTHVLGWLVGKPAAAAPLAARLLDVDPLNAMSLLVIAMAPLFAGRFSDALEPARRMFALDPVTPVLRANYVMALSYNQRLDEAEALTEGVAAQPDSDVGTWWMGLFRAAWRMDRAEVLRLANGPYQQAAAWDAEIPWALASAHAAVGAKEEALLWLERAIERGMINYPFLSEHDRYLDSIRGDARFGRVIERARQEWERFEV